MPCMHDMLGTSNRMPGSAQNDGLRVALQFLGAVIRKRVTGLGKVAAAAVDAGCVLVSVTGGSDNREEARVGMEKGSTLGSRSRRAILRGQTEFHSKVHPLGQPRLLQ